MRKMIYKRFKEIIGILMILSFVSVAQVNVDEAVDFSLTDVDGITHNLFDYLSDGKYVVINLTLMG